jgi:acyl dehydratase
MSAESNQDDSENSEDVSKVNDVPPEDGLVHGRITDADVEMLRRRIGYPNPTLRRGVITKPWNTTVNADAVRRWAESNGDMNPLFNDAEYAARTRWAGTIAPPGFEWSMGISRLRAVPEDLQQETRKALRGVQLFHSGAEYRYYRALTEGTTLYRADWVADVAEKKSKFATRSVIANNATCWWTADEQVAIEGERWFVHAERRPVAKKKSEPKDEVLPYTDEQMSDIEAAYDNEYVRGPDTLYFEDVKVGDKLPLMVKGPLTITDMINTYMGNGWLTYGNPPFRLAYENRKLLRGFYSKDEYNAWDTVQRVHWDIGLAHKVGVRHLYDIGPMRLMMLCHYLSNYTGDDGWVFRYRYELRNFNYVGDTTWLSGQITAVRVDPALGPVVDLEVVGTNQRGQENIRATATLLVASRKQGPVEFPAAPAVTPYRS